MKRSVAYACSVVVLSALLVAQAEEKCQAVYGHGPNRLTVATGSPGELGLLKVIAEAFAAQHNATVRWRKAGSGKSLKLLHGKEVDAVMVHAPAAEKKAVAEGWARKRTLIGSNEFYIVGPKSDPAAIASAKTAAEAYAKIAAARARFLSRADNSGTHKKELAVWQKAGVTPEGAWYIQTHDFMTATLLRANEVEGYFMTDSSTWVAAKSQTPKLAVLFKGDPMLVNIYHALCQPEGATPGAALGAQFVEFLASKEAQRMFADFGKEAYGQPIYNDAAYAGQFE